MWTYKKQTIYQSKEGNEIELTSNSFLPSVNRLGAEKLSKLPRRLFGIVRSRTETEVSHKCWHFQVLQACLVSQKGHNLDESERRDGLLLSY